MTWRVDWLRYTLEVWRAGLLMATPPSAGVADVAAAWCTVTSASELVRLAILFFNPALDCGLLLLLLLCCKEALRLTISAEEED